MSLAFTVKHHSSKCNGRIGQLVLPNGSLVETPTALMYTVRGSVPHLAPDMLGRLATATTSNDGSHVQLLHYFYEHIIGSYGFGGDETSALNDRPLLEKMYNSRYVPPSTVSTVIFASLHDVVRKSILSPNHYGDKFVSVATDQRVVKLDNERFAQWLQKLTASGRNQESDLLALQTNYDGQEAAPANQMDSESKSTSFSETPDSNRTMWWLSPLHDFVPDVECGPKRIRKSVDRTLNFLDTLLSSSSTSSSSLNYQIAGVIEGGIDIDERRRSLGETATRFAEHPNRMFGYIVDSMFIGESREERNQVLETAVSGMNEYAHMQDQPRIMFQCRSLQDILDAVERGIDIFDSGFPVNLTEMGQALVLNPDDDGCDDQTVSAFKQINLWDDSFTRDWQPLMRGCKCFACDGKHTRAYIHHLLQTHEMLAPILLMSHNMHQYLELFARIRRTLKPQKKNSGDS